MKRVRALVWLGAAVTAAALLSGCAGNKPPDAPAIEGPGSTSRNVACEFQVSSVDPNGDSVMLRAEWGNGDTSDWSTAVVSGDTVVLVNSWADTGAFSVRTQAKDPDEALSGWSAAHTVSVYVTNPPNTPETPAGPDTGRTDTLYSYSSSATHPDGDSLSLRFAWGDGDTSAWSGLVTPGTPVTATHAWSAPGVYEVRTQARDRKALVSGWSAARTVAVDTGSAGSKDVVELVPLDNEISGWSRNGAMAVCETPQQLYALIDGEGQVYIDNGFVKSAFQDYAGQVGGNNIDLELRIFDMGDTVQAANVYAAVATGSEQPWTGDNPGRAARIDQTLFAYKVDFWDMEFYTSVTIQDNTQAGLNVAKLFALNVGQAIHEP